MMNNSTTTEASPAAPATAAAWRELIQEGVDQLDRGEVVDGRVVMEQIHKRLSKLRDTGDHEKP